MTIDDLENWEAYLMSPAEAMSAFEDVTVDDETAAGVRNGMRFVGGPLVSGPEGEPFAVKDEEGELLAVYSRVGDQARPEVVLPS